MVKKMNKRKRMVRGAAVFVTLAAIAVIVRAIIRKRRAHITYGPMHERDRIRFDYLNQKIWQSDVLCKNMLRFERAAFFRLCGILRDRKLLEDSPHLSVEQQLAMFLYYLKETERSVSHLTSLGIVVPRRSSRAAAHGPSPTKPTSLTSHNKHTM